MNKRLYQSLGLLAVLIVFVAMALINIPLTARAATVDDLTYEIVDGEVTITDCDTNASGELIIPATIDGYPVTSIGDFAFSDCSGLTSVTIPNNVTTIGEEAFYDCRSLSSVTIPDSVTKVGIFAFSGCANLSAVYITDIAAWCNISFSHYTSVPFKNDTKLYLNGVLVTDLVIPDGKPYIGCNFYNYSYLSSVTITDGVTTIGGMAFCGCSNLASITIANSVTTIENMAFYGCASLSSVTIPNSVTGIYDHAFEECTGLTSVVLSNSLTSIVHATFFRCSSLTSVQIPNGVTNIADDAFYGCTNMTSVSIPDSVTAIGFCAFSVCDSLKDIYYTGTQEQWGQINIVASGNDDLLNATLHFNYAPCAVIGHPVNRYAVVGNTATFAVVAEGTELTYQWQYRTSAKDSWKNDAGTGNKTATLSVAVTAARNGYQYRCVITDKYGNVVSSNAATLTVVTLKVTAQPVGANLPVGKTAKFTVKATGTGLKYQWQYRTSAKGSWKAAINTGSKTATLSVPVTVAHNGYQYRCVITDKYGNVVNSNAATLKVVTLKVTKQPATKYLPAGKTAKFTVKVSGTGLKYQWQYRKNAKGTWKNASGTGNKKATLSVAATAARNGYQYRCKITDKYGNVIYSKVATLKIVTLKITAQPSSVTLAQGKTAAFKVVAKGTKLKYQWQYRKNAKSAWKKATNKGNKTATLKVPVTAARNGYQYRCVITDKYGNMIYSKAAKLTVRASAIPKATVTDAYVKTDGEFCYHIPKINLPGNTAAAINKVIYNKAIEEVKKGANYDEGLPVLGLHYTWSQYKDVLSLVIQYGYDTDLRGYSVYNISTVTGKELTKAQVAQKLGITVARGEAIARAAVKKYFDQNKQIASIVGQDLYDWLLEETLSDRNISNLKFFINDAGKLCFTGSIGSWAGAGSYDYIIHQNGTLQVLSCKIH